MNNYIEPSEEQIKIYMENSGEDYYNSREKLKLLYNGPPPDGFDRWGDYWKSY